MSEYANGAVHLDLLDGLLKQSEALDQKLRIHYPDIFADVPSSDSSTSSSTMQEIDDSFYFSSIDETDPNESVDYTYHDEKCEETEEIDEQSLQMYSLRRKYENLPADSTWDTAVNAQTYGEKRTSCSPDHYSDAELFLHAISKMANGIKDEASYATTQMEQRKRTDALLQFLPIYTALDNGSSRAKILRLLSQRNVDGKESEPDSLLVSLSQQMLHSVMQVITDAEALEDAGYRNRQEALRVAAGKAQQRVNDLRKRTY